MSDKPNGRKRPFQDLARPQHFEDDDTSPEAEQAENLAIDQELQQAAWSALVHAVRMLKLLKIGEKEACQHLSETYATLEHEKYPPPPPGMEDPGDLPDLA